MTKAAIKGDGSSDFITPVLSLHDASAHIEAALLDVVHSDLAPEQKLAALKALASLAQSFSVAWAQRLPAYGSSGERIWWRLCGLSTEGEVPATMLARINDA